MQIVPKIRNIPFYYSFLILQDRVAFTAFNNATHFDFDQSETLPVVANATTVDDFYGSEFCINSGVVGASIQDREEFNVINPIKIS